MRNMVIQGAIVHFHEKIHENSGSVFLILAGAVCLNAWVEPMAFAPQSLPPPHRACASSLPVLRAFVILNRVEDVHSLLYDYRCSAC